MMNYEYDRENAVVHLRASGVLEAADPINYFRQLVEEPLFLPKVEERIYFVDLEDITFSFLDMVEIRNAFEKYDHGSKISHGVFVVDTDMSFGMARMVISVFGKIFEDFVIERKSPRRRFVA